MFQNLTLSAKFKGGKIVVDFFNFLPKKDSKLAKRTVFCYFGHGKLYFFSCFMANYFSVHYSFS